jgi:hypothetical protein
MIITIINTPHVCADSTADTISQVITTIFIPIFTGIIAIRSFSEQVFISDIISGIRERAGGFIIARAGIIRRGRITVTQLGVVRRGAITDIITTIATTTRTIVGTIGTIIATTTITTTGTR